MERPMGGLDADSGRLIAWECPGCVRLTTMSDSDRLIDLEGVRLEPYLSAYLMGGVKEDVPILDRVSVRGKHCEGVARLKSYFVSDSEGRFHLSMLAGTILVTQLGVVHGLVLSDREKKSIEVYMSDFDITLQRQITKPSGIRLVLDVVNKIVVPAGTRRKTPRSFYRWHFTVGDDDGVAWSGTITLVFPF